MTAAAFGTAGTYLSSTTGAPSFAVPASVASGDMIAVVMFLNAAATVTGMPSGFAHADGSPVAGGSNSLVVAVKRATGSDTGTYDFTLSGSTFVEGRAHRYTGAVASGALLDTPSGKAFNNTAATAAPAVSVTTLGADRLLLYAATNWSGGSWTAPPGFTERTDAGVGLVTWDDLAQAGAGGSGNVSATSSSSDRMIAWVGALIPATAGNPSAAPDGLAVAIAFGTVTAALGQSSAPNGVAVPITFGAPNLLGIIPNGVAVPITFGSLVVSTAPASSPVGGGWDQLAGIYWENRLNSEQYVREAPTACPYCGEPLVRNDRLDALGCTFDGWQYRG